MDNKSKLFLAFGAGALVGAGLAALFTTDEGKELVDKAKKEVGNMADDLKKTFEGLQNEFADLMKNETPKEDPGTQI